MTRLQVPQWFLLLAAFTLISGCSAGQALSTLGGGPPNAIERDIAYGDHKRQRYDIYYPAEEVNTSPVVVFFYGGAWQRGSRKDYVFVGAGLARQGLTAVVVDYRLSPEVSFPDFVFDGAKAIAHIKRTIATDRALIVAGHSAGAHIAALIATDGRYLEAFDRRRCTTVAGFIGLAGPYDFLPIQRTDVGRVFPEATRAQSQPINFVDPASPPALLVHGDADTTVIPRNSIRLDMKLKQAGVRSRNIEIPGAGHIKPLLAIGPSASQVFGADPAIKSAIAQFALTLPAQRSAQCAFEDRQ